MKPMTTLNMHKISPQIEHAMMGFRRRSHLAEGLQSNYNNITIVLTNAEWKKACKGQWEKWEGSNIYPTTVSDRKVVSRGNTSDVFGVFRVQISAHILSRPRWRSWLRHRYKTEGRGFDSLQCHWNFSWTQSFRTHYSPGTDSASSRNSTRNVTCEVMKVGA